MITNRLNLIIIVTLFLVLCGTSVYIQTLQQKIESNVSFEILYNTEQQLSQKNKDDADYWKSRAKIAERTIDNLEGLKGVPAQLKEIRRNLKKISASDTLIIAR
jgi:predicted Holliday junction resolvase-like endonuclease